MTFLTNQSLKKFTFILILLLYGFHLTYKIQLPAADDMARHVRNGELIMHGNFKVLYSNVFSYTMPGQRFINHHWLAGVIFYLLYLVMGWGGLVIFKVAVLLATFLLLFRTALRKADFWLVALFSLPALIVLSERSSLRPEVFSYLFIAAFLHLLTGMEEHHREKKILWLIPLQLLWVNIHIFFIAGPALIGGFLLEKIVHQLSERKRLHFDTQIKNLFFLLAASIAICFFNPNGAAGALYPFHIFTDYGMDVSENRSVLSILRTSPPTENFTIYFFYASVVFLGLSFLFNFKKRPVFYFIAYVSTAIAGFEVVRFISLLGLFFLPAITSNLNSFFMKLKNGLKADLLLLHKSTKIPGYAFIIVLITVVVMIVNGNVFNYNETGIGLTKHSEDAAVFMKEINFKGPVFNDYDIGSYLIYHLYPKDKVFMDNRPEAYSASFFKDTYLPVFETEDGWQKADEQYHFNSIVLYQYNFGPGVREFMYKRFRDSSWALVYADIYAVVFLKNNDENKGIIQKYRITPDNVAQRVDYLLKSNDYEDKVAAADVFNLAGRTDLGMETFFRVVCQWPDKGKIWMVMGIGALSDDENKRSPLLAIMYFDKALSVGYKKAEVYSYLGKAYYKIGFTEKAVEAFQNALRINPEQQDANDYIEKIRSEKAVGK